MKVLLQAYLDNKQWDLSGFVDLILGQPTVGTVVKVENDEDEGVYSVVSALNLGRYKASNCLCPSTLVSSFSRSVSVIVDVMCYMMAKLKLHNHYMCIPS